MNAITYYALQAARKTGDLNIDALMHILGEMDERRAERTVEALIGLVDIPQMMATIPTLSKADKDTICVLDSFNYLDDMVRFKYTRTDTKYFLTPEEADKYTSTGDYKWDKYKTRQEGEYVFEGNYTHESNDYCSYQRWMDNAIEEEA